VESIICPKLLKNDIAIGLPLCSSVRWEYWEERCDRLSGVWPRGFMKILGSEVGRTPSRTRPGIFGSGT
jgi:hypothetical protein